MVLNNLDILKIFNLLKVYIFTFLNLVHFFLLILQLFLQFLNLRFKSIFLLFLFPFQFPNLLQKLLLLMNLLLLFFLIVPNNFNRNLLQSFHSRLIIIFCIPMRNHVTQIHINTLSIDHNNQFLHILFQF